MTMPPLIILGGRLGAPVVWIKSTAAGIGAQRGKESKKDVLLGGLLVPGFDEQSCASRYQSVYYYKNMTRRPSPYLVKRLREQEALQRGAVRAPSHTSEHQIASGPGQQQTSTPSTAAATSCSSLTEASATGCSAFLYALLTGRVLLVDPGRGNTLPRLFCEPFPGTAWVLPPDFPLDKFRDLDEAAPETYGNVVVNRSVSVSGLRLVYLHLDHDASPANLLAYCDDHRQFLHRVQWAILRADQYITAGLFFNPAYREELDRLFPKKDSVFHLLSRYLLHPTNDIWGMVTRFFNAYLKDADERLGIQIRVFDSNKPLQRILDQVLACTSQEHLLPAVVSQDGGGGAPPIPTAGGLSKAVLVTGLSSWYHDNIREMYWKSAAADGEVVSVHQPSHEGYQRWFHGDHDMKALAEIYLLSLTDKIVTSGWSTFGYAGTGLGGLTPYIMFRAMDGMVPKPPCMRAMSMEPCSFAVPPFDCTRKEINRDVLQGNVPHVRACEDVFWGVKLTDTV